MSMLPHPATRRDLFGHDDVETTLRLAVAGNRLPHALLISGPNGVGKATLGYRLARFLLAHGPVAGKAAELATDLSIAPDHPAARLIATGAHPDLFVVGDAANGEGGGTVQVDAVREVIRRMTHTSAGGAWRVALIDPAEALNRNAANAILKLLEEPPPYALFILISHTPGLMPATIRSRTVRLRLRPLGDDAFRACLASLDLDAGGDVGLAYRLSGGVPGAAATLLTDGLADIAAFADLLDNPGKGDAEAVRMTAGKLARKDNLVAFEAALVRFRARLHDRLRTEAANGATLARLAETAELWDKAREAVRDVTTFNLDRARLVETLLHDARGLDRSPSPRASERSDP